MKKYLEYGIISIFIASIGIISLYLLTTYLPELTAFPAILGNVGTSLFIFYIYDKFVLKNIDTNEILQKGNNFGLYILAIAIIIAASIIAS